MGYKIETIFEEIPIKCKVGPGGDSGRVYVPKSMIGKMVIIAVIPEKEQKESKRDNQ